MYSAMVRSFVLAVTVKCRSQVRKEGARPFAMSCRSLSMLRLQCPVSSVTCICMPADIWGRCWGRPVAASTIRCCGCARTRRAARSNDPVLRAERDGAIIPQLPHRSLWVPRPAGLFHATADCHIGQGDLFFECRAVFAQRAPSCPLTYRQSNVMNSGASLRVVPLLP